MAVMFLCFLLYIVNLDQDTKHHVIRCLFGNNMKLTALSLFCKPMKNVIQTNKQSRAIYSLSPFMGLSTRESRFRSIRINVDFRSPDQCEL